MSAKQRDTNAATAAAMQTERESVLVPSRRKRVDLDFGPAQEELAQTQLNLQRSQDNERESRQLSNEAKRRETATNKTLKDMSAQEKANKEENAHQQVAFKAAERAANDERIAIAAATETAFMTAQTTTDTNLAAQLKM